MLTTEITETSAPYRITYHTPANSAARWVVACVACDRCVIVAGEERPDASSLAMARAPKAHRNWCDHKMEPIETPEQMSAAVSYGAADDLAKKAGYVGVNAYPGSCHRCRSSVPAYSGGYLRAGDRSVQVFHLDPLFCAGEIERLRQLRAIRPTAAPVQAPPSLPPSAADPEPSPQLHELLELY